MKISVIIAYHGEANYIKDCLGSLADQSYGDFEVIVVCDGCEKPDTGPFSALKLRFLKCSAGNVAKVRNIGLEAAKGEYLYFLDTDDYLDGEVLGGLAGLAVPGGVVYGKLRHTWYGRKVYLGNGAKTAGFSMGESHNPYDCLMKRARGLQNVTILGMLVSRSVVDRNHIRFDEKCKYFADVPFLLQVLAASGSTVFCETGCYIKRRHNDPVNLPSLIQWKDEKGKSLEAIQMFSEYKCFIPKGDSEIWFDYKFVHFFMKKIVPFIVKAKPETGEEVCRGLREALGQLGSGVYDKLGSYEKRLLKCGRRGRAEQIAQKARFHFRMQTFWRVCKSRAELKRYVYKKVFSKLRLLSDTIMFESFFGKSYSDNPKYIFEYLNRNYPGKYKYVWVNAGKELPLAYPAKQLKRFGFAYFYYMARCKYMVFNGRQPHYFIKRPGNIFLETWHGTPLKKLVFDMDDVTTASPLYKEQFYVQTRSWDYLVAPNLFSENIFRRAFLYDGEILQTGYPRNDILYAGERKPLVAEIKEELGIPRGKKVILYAPTWRDDEFYGHAKYKFSLKLDLQPMREQLGEEYVVLLRTHYFIADQIDLCAFDGFAYNVSKYDDIARLYIISDLLVTDYSSVFFDYANLRRPMLFFMYDLDKYKNVLRGFYMDVEEELPGPIVFDTQEIVDAVKNIGDIEKKYEEKYNRFCEKYCAWEDGHATEKVVNAVFDCE